MRLADGPTVDVDIYIDAPPERVWEVCTDLIRMGEWSPENLGGEWLEEGGPSVGSRFKGRNRIEGMGEWDTISTVVECEAPRSFAWAVVDPDNPAATWRFDLEPEGSGTRLRQHVLMGPGPSGLTAAIAERPDDEERLVEWRRRDHRTKMTATLDGIKAAVEG